MDEIRLEREFDLPRGIVWEALVDPQLVGGWLHPSDRLVSGTVPVTFREPDDPAEPAVLAVISPSFGAVSITLVRREGGRRGQTTRLHLTVSDAWGRRAERESLWALRLDQLAALLRGHPVDWGTWAAEHRDAEVEARAEAARRSAR